MEILPVSAAYYESMKKYWRRRKYQRLYSTNTSPSRKLKVMRLGGKVKRRQYDQIRAKSALSRCRIALPIKLLAKFHKAYVKLVIRLFGGDNNTKSSKNHIVSVISTGEEVDSRLVMQIYNKYAASKRSTEVLSL